MSSYVIYTDGANKPSIKQGGIGVVWIKDGDIEKTYSHAYKDVTNQKMELGAMIAGFEYLIKKGETLDKLTVVSDSEYAIGCASRNWKMNKNVKLRIRLNNAVKNCQMLVKTPIEFKWVKGHSDDEFNCLADELASNASKELLL
jgi:ribonuclease HI